MVYRKLGRTNITVSAISLGCEGFMDKSAGEIRADFDFAEANGINFFDLYASNPSLRSNIGLALKGRREKFIIQGHICSTWENGQYLHTRDVAKSKTAFEDQLERLGVSYIDVGMIHYVDNEQDIAGINKYLNLTVAQDSIPETVREHYKLLERHASECIEYGQCETRCPFQVNIIDHMQRAMEKFGY